LPFAIFKVARMPMMLLPNAAPPVLRQIEQKQNMNGTGVSDSTEKWILPHWHEPARRARRFFDVDFVDLGMPGSCDLRANW
jgi:hypothetical protein